MLHGLSAEEAAWLARKAEHLGGLGAALRYLLRTGLLSFLYVIDAGNGTTGDAPATLKVCASPVGVTAALAGACHTGCG